jgi:hypothetical protein
MEREDVNQEGVNGESTSAGLVNVSLVTKCSSTQLDMKMMRMSDTWSV